MLPLLGFSAFTPAWYCGCQGKSPERAASIPAAPPVRNPASLIRYLPPGTSFKSPIVSDKILGGHTKTVEQALGRLQVTARDGALVDGLGREIKFVSLKEMKSNSKDVRKTLGRLRAKYCVLVIADDADSEETHSQGGVKKAP